MNYPHIMIDLETLGTTADAVILSIGAVRFDLDSGTVADPNGSYSFYQELDILSQHNHQRRISASTLAWWMSQPKEAQAVFNNDTDKSSLGKSLYNLSDWVQQGTDKPLVWSNGADFDLPMLAHAYTQLDIALPWAAYSGRCYRTYKNLPGARAVKVPRLGQHHNALDDAMYQAQHLCAIHAALFGRKGAV